MPTLRISAAAVLGAALLAAGLWWWLYRAGPPPFDQRSLTLLVSGDTAGWIVPCGCTSNQSGGLLRRGSHVESLRHRGSLIYADVGGAPGGTSEYHQVKFEAILQGEAALGLDAHNLGGSEAALGADYLQQTAARYNIPFLSANLRKADGTPVAPPLRVVERGGHRIGLVGVLSPRSVPAGLRADEPREAILQAIHAPGVRYDSLVVLAYLPEDELRQLAASLPEADAILGGPTGQSIAPQAAGPTLLAAATNKGKFLVELNASTTGKRVAWSGRVIEMGQEIADHAPQVENLRRYLHRLAERDFAAQETGLASALPDKVQQEYRIAGTAACMACHKSDCVQWGSSKHAHAWATLSEKHYHVDSYCQQCHTTGFGLPGGFTSAKQSFTTRSVGCESCHGPAAGHARDPKLKTPFPARDQCVRCHDRENSPTFDYGTYWPKIYHGPLPR